MTGQLRIAFFGSSLVSAYWNGAATYYRGIIEALHHLGHKITFYEPDAFDRQKHRDLDGVPYARSVVYSPEIESMRWCLDEARAADVVVKCSRVGVLDDVLEEAVLELRHPSRKVVFWDVDAPATLERVQSNPGDPFRGIEFPKMPLAVIETQAVDLVVFLAGNGHGGRRINTAA